jgi:hypothetical protein
MNEFYLTNKKTGDTSVIDPMNAGLYQDTTMYDLKNAPKGSIPVTNYNAQVNTAPITTGNPTMGDLVGLKGNSGPGGRGRTAMEQQFDEQAVRDRVMQGFRAQIDATNQIYEQKLAESRQQGQGRLGTAQVAGVRTGAAGSPFAQAQEKQVLDANSRIQNTINAERAAAIAAIEGRGSEATTAELSRKRLEQEKDAETYLDFLTKKEERDRSAVGAAIYQNIKALGDTLEQSEIDQITKAFGTDPAIVISEFQKLKATTAKSTAEQQKALLEQQKAESDIEYRKAQTVNELAPKSEAFNLSEGQARYDADGKLIAQRGKTYAPKSVSYVTRGASITSESPESNDALSLAEQVVAGLMTMKEVPSAMRASVAQAMNHPVILNKKKDELQSYVDIANELLNNGARSRITGPVDQFAGGVFGKAALAKNQYNQIKNIVSLAGREKLKGTGTITDFEAKQLEKAGTALGRNLSEGDFDAQVLKVIDVLEGAKNRSRIPDSNVQETTKDIDPLGIR